jgi:hypothetical protein
MKYAIATLIISVLFLAGAISYAQAEPYVSVNLDTTAHSLASRSISSISRASRYGIDTTRAMRYQAEGDEALHRGDVVRAAEEWGRAEEAIRVLEAERRQALDARRIAQREMDRARRNGTYNLTPAEIDFQRGNEALANGDFVTAQLYYAEARASIAVG